jgi:hypothetical protein
LIRKDGDFEIRRYEEILVATFKNAPESMSFVVPSEYNKENVLEPTDERVSINEIPERYVATVRFSDFLEKQCK